MEVNTLKLMDFSRLVQDVAALKYNMEPENDGFQKEFPFLGGDFQVQCLTSGGCNGQNVPSLQLIFQGCCNTPLEHMPKPFC